MTRIVDASAIQRRDITAIVADDVEREPLGSRMIIPDGFDSVVRLMAHPEARIPESGLLSTALGGMPTIASSDGRVTFLSGAMQVGAALAGSLSEAIQADPTLSLWIPHGYAVPGEIASLQPTYEGHAVVVGGHVYMKFQGAGIEPELIRRALASMIGCYSVGWLVSAAAGPAVARLAIVPIFDGDGFALGGPMAPTRTA
jgi:hypothetical protein